MLSQYEEQQFRDAVRVADDERLNEQYRNSMGCLVGLICGVVGGVSAAHLTGSMGVGVIAFLVIGSIGAMIGYVFWAWFVGVAVVAVIAAVIALAFAGDFNAQSKGLKDELQNASQQPERHVEAER